MEQLPQILNVLAGQDYSQRQLAERELANLEQLNPAGYLHGLATHLATEAASPDSRNMAGILLKNSVSNEKDKRVHLMKAQSWMHIPPEQRYVIKNLILLALRSPVLEARHSAAVTCAQIGIIEIERNEWQELIKSLFDNMTSGDDFVKHSSLETLGYLCEDINSDAIPEYLTNQILNVIVSGISLEGELRRAAIVALLNSLRFVKTTFETQNDRDYIMRVILSSTSDNDVKVRRTAFECLVRVADNYYDKLSGYMAPIFQVTTEAITTPNNDEEVILQAIEFWSSVCDEETRRLDVLDSLPRGAAPPFVCHHIIEEAIKQQIFISALTQMLTTQDEDADDDTWNPAMSAGACLGLIANTVGDLVVPVIMPFINANVRNPDWRAREAAAMAFGAILDGPTGADLLNVMTDAIRLFIEQLATDTSVPVKDTTAWTIGRIAELHPTTILPMLHDVINVLGRSLQDDPKVANSACWALNNLFELFEDDAEKGTSPISKYFADLLQALMATSDREDADEANLRVSAYEVINKLIQVSPHDCQPMLGEVLPVFLARLNRTFSPDVDKEEQNQLQAYISSVINSITFKVGDEIISFVPDIMGLLLRVFQSKSNTVHEEALSAVGGIAQCLEANFSRWMPEFHPYLVLGLRNHEESAVCLAAVGVVGDCCRSLGAAIVPYCNDIVGSMLQALQVLTLNKKVKIAILSAFGDIALAIGHKFEPYLEHVCPVLQDASQTTGDTSKEETVEYLNALREGVFEAYTGIIQGLRQDERAIVFLPYLEHLFGFMQYVWSDNSKGVGVLKGMVGILGDIACALGSQQGVAEALRSQFVVAILAHGADHNSTRELALWAQMSIAEL